MYPNNHGYISAKIRNTDSLHDDIRWKIVCINTENTCVASEKRLHVVFKVEDLSLKTHHYRQELIMLRR